MLSPPPLFSLSAAFSHGHGHPLCGKAVCRGWMDVTSTLSTLLEPPFPASRGHVVTRAPHRLPGCGGDACFIGPGRLPFFVHVFAVKRCRWPSLSRSAIAHTLSFLMQFIICITIYLNRLGIITCQKLLGKLGKRVA